MKKYHYEIPFNITKKLLTREVSIDSCFYRLHCSSGTLVSEDFVRIPESGIRMAGGKS